MFESSSTKAVPESIDGPINHYLESTSKKQRIGAAILGLAGAGMLVVSFLSATMRSDFFVHSDRGITLITFFRACGGLFIVLAFLSMLLIVRRRKRMGLILGALYGANERVVWVYQEERFATPKDPSITETVRTYVCMDDGKVGWFDNLEHDANETTEYFREEFPSISIGYSRGLLERYRTDPMSPKASPVRTDKRKKYRHKSTS